MPWDVYNLRVKDREKWLTEHIAQASAHMTAVGQTGNCWICIV